MAYDLKNTKNKNLEENENVQDLKKRKSSNLVKELERKDTWHKYAKENIAND